MSADFSEREKVSPSIDSEAHEVKIIVEGMQPFSKAMAYGYGYIVDIAISDTLLTSATRHAPEEDKILIEISRHLIECAEAEDQMDFLCFNILHELGHVKRLVNQPVATSTDPKDMYFHNVVDDIAINYDAARKTRFFSDITKKAYDSYLFPAQLRDSLVSQPKHMQFMGSLLLIAMTTTSYRKPQSPEELSSALNEIGCADIDPAVVKKLSEVVNFKTGQNSHNLLRQIREFGEDIPYYNRVISHIRKMYDELYEVDLQDQQDDNQPEPGDDNHTPGDDIESSGDDEQSSSGDDELSDDVEQSDVEQSPSGSHHNLVDEPFDYSNSGGCHHNYDPGDINAVDPKNNEDLSENVSRPFNFAEIGKEIGSQIADIMQEETNQSVAEKPLSDLNEEQLITLKKELNLEESDFQAFLETVNRYRGEIASITDLILQLRRERQDNFLAPCHEVAARGHRINIGKLIGYLASNSKDPTPNIWKSSAFKEKLEYEFDGADFYFLCDVSTSMEGDRANAASDSAVVLSQGIHDASLEAYNDAAPIRIQVQAFGESDQTLCELTDSPKNIDLGRMYSSLRNPESEGTEVSDALAKIKPEAGRLSVVLVLSDGLFYDEDLAIAQSTRLANEGAVIVQCVFGDEEVSVLSDNAKRIDIESASDLPDYLFGIMPELIEVLRRSSA